MFSRLLEGLPISVPSLLEEKKECEQKEEREQPGRFQSLQRKYVVAKCPYCIIRHVVCGNNFQCRQCQRVYVYDSVINEYVLSISGLFKENVSLGGARYLHRLDHALVATEIPATPPLNESIQAPTRTLPYSKPSPKVPKQMVLLSQIFRQMDHPPAQECSKAAGVKDMTSDSDAGTQNNNISFHYSSAERIDLDAAQGHKKPRLPSSTKTTTRRESERSTLSVSAIQLAQTTFGYPARITNNGDNAQPSFRGKAQHTLSMHCLDTESISVTSTHKSPIHSVYSDPVVLCTQLALSTSKKEVTHSFLLVSDENQNARAKARGSKRRRITGDEDLQEERKNLETLGTVGTLDTETNSKGSEGHKGIIENIYCSDSFASSRTRSKTRRKMYAMCASERHKLQNDNHKPFQSLFDHPIIKTSAKVSKKLPKMSPKKEYQQYQNKDQAQTRIKTKEENKENKENKEMKEKKEKKESQADFVGLLSKKKKLRITDIQPLTKTLAEQYSPVLADAHLAVIIAKDQAANDPHGLQKGQLKRWRMKKLH